ncbi:MAG: hypothetical protein GKR89_09735 [Candidatus Latescibacteria bacterium]|nr:hypothetical protein [Candidatus Latescibacterota bacterium]
MDRSCLDHILTDQERQQFRTNGYLVIENALDTETLETAVAAVDRIDTRLRQQQGLSQEQRLNTHDCIGKDAALLDLIDYPTTFPKVWGLMGWNIYLFHTQMIATPPTSKIPPAGQKLGWHQDQNRSNGDLDLEDLPINPMLSLKVAFFLTDTTEVGVANFYVAPRQQANKQIIYADDESTMPVNGMPLRVNGGSAVLFDRRLWHAASPNYLNRPRKVLFYGYAYRWIRPKCIMEVDHLLENIDPIRRQLLGTTTAQDHYYLPSDEDVPLRTWLKENSDESFAWSHR